MKNKAKEPMLSILLNSVFLGLGHLYAGAKNRGKVILFVIIGLLIVGYTWALHPTDDLKFLSAISGHESFSFGFFYALSYIIIILVWIDGYKCTKKYNSELLL